MDIEDSQKKRSAASEHEEEQSRTEAISKDALERWTVALAHESKENITVDVDMPNQLWIMGGRRDEV
jgi:hypothetical protein